MMGKLLVVDDDDQVRETLRSTAEALGYTADVAADGRAGQALLQQGQYDVVLCDLTMPVMTGDELFFTCRRTLPETARRFVFLTGSPPWSDEGRQVAAMGQPYVCKPYRLADLVSAFRALETQGPRPRAYHSTPTPQIMAALRRRSGGRCECRLPGCGHTDTCATQLPAPAEGPSPFFFVGLTDDVEDVVNWYAFCTRCLAYWSGLHVEPDNEVV